MIRKLLTPSLAFFFAPLLALLLAVFAVQAATAVDVNRANQAELETVKGIGPGLSAKILKARETGAFKDWNDMVDRVSGIGPGNAKRFSQAGLTVGGAVYEPAAGAAPAAAPAKARAGSKEGTKATKASKPVE